MTANLRRRLDSWRRCPAWMCTSRTRAMQAWPTDAMPRRIKNTHRTSVASEDAIEDACLAAPSSYCPATTARPRTRVSVMLLRTIDDVKPPSPRHPGRVLHEHRGTASTSAHNPLFQPLHETFPTVRRLLSTRQFPSSGRCSHQTLCKRQVKRARAWTSELHQLISSRCIAFNFEEYARTQTLYTNRA